jgi:hypothetical protein
MRVFVSYSHDSREHEQRVRALADQLRIDGIEAWIDQYVQDPDAGWIKWMRTEVKEAEKVLLVFTEAYQRRFEGDEEEGKGLGATFEGVIVTQALYESGGRNAKFRPVVFSDEERALYSFRTAALQSLPSRHPGQLPKPPSLCGKNSLMRPESMSGFERACLVEPNAQEKWRKLSRK